MGKLYYFTKLNSSAIWGWFPLLTMIPGFGRTGFGWPLVRWVSSAPAAGKFTGWVGWLSRWKKMVNQEETHGFLMETTPSNTVTYNVTSIFFPEFVTETNPMNDETILPFATGTKPGRQIKNKTKEPEDTRGTVALHVCHSIISWYAAWELPIKIKNLSAPCRAQKPLYNYTMFHRGFHYCPPFFNMFQNNLKHIFSPCSN